MLLMGTSCQRNKVESSDDTSSDTLSFASFQADTLSLENEEIQEAEAEAHFDRSFDDFLYVFTRSRRLQGERVAKPLLSVDEFGDTLLLKVDDWHAEFQFLEGEYYTVLFGRYDQMEQIKDDTLIQARVERIDLQQLLVTRYNFECLDGKWMLTSQNVDKFENTQMSDFLHFYAQFSSDSIFQQLSIAQPLRVSMFDEEEEEQIDGTIDALQWSTFCSGVPEGVISNVYYGQQYDTRYMVMQKCGDSNGMQEIFTFQKNGAHWKLTSYEN